MAAEVQGKTAEAAPFPQLLASTAEPAGIAVEGFSKALVSSKIPVNTAIGYAPIFVGGILNAMADVDLQLMFHTKALVGRFYKRKKKGKIGFAKVLVPDGEVDRALSQDSSVSGRKLRVVRWDGGPVGPRPGCTIRLLRLPPVESGPNIEAAVGLFEVVKFQVRPVLHL